MLDYLTEHADHRKQSAIRAASFVDGDGDRLRGSRGQAGGALRYATQLGKVVADSLLMADSSWGGLRYAVRTGRVLLVLKRCGTM